jgi:hypothetical protein
MIEKVFFDTNLFIYAYTTNEPKKSNAVPNLFPGMFRKKEHRYQFAGTIRILCGYGVTPVSP